MKALVGLLAGSVFGIGLAASGMTDTAKVIGFLDITGNWDPDLLWVMGSAVLVTLIGYPIALKEAKPLFAEAFSQKNSDGVDAKLLLGAAIFGTGWGLYGYCPGPAIAALVYQSATTLLFVLAMILGMASCHWLQNQLSK